MRGKEEDDEKEEGEEEEKEEDDAEEAANEDDANRVVEEFCMGFRVECNLVVVGVETLGSYELD